MGVWLQRGGEVYRWDLFLRLGRPPSVVPPPWSLVERISEVVHGSSAFGTGSESAEGGSRETGPELSPVCTPSTWAEELERNLPPGDEVCLVVPDATRVGAWRELLGSVLDLLEERYSRRTLLVATGTHDPAAAGELRVHLRTGPRSGWNWCQNSEAGFRDHVEVGRTVAGTPFRLHPLYLQAPARVLLGETSYHYFAGFGGGAKLVFPGCAEPEGAAHNHAMACDVEGPEWTWEPRCGPGMTEDNPVLDDILAAARLAPAQHAIFVASDPPREMNELDPSSPVGFPLRVFQGSPEEAAREAHGHHDSLHQVSFTRRPEVLVVDQGGWPRDRTFLQTQKAIQHGVRFLSEEGRLLVVAACAEGWGSPTLARYARSPIDFAFRDGDPHRQTLTALRAALTGYEVGLWSDLPSREVEGMGMHSLQSEEQALDWVRGSEWGWLPRVERFLPAEIRLPTLD